MSNEEKENALMDKKEEEKGEEIKYAKGTKPTNFSLLLMIIILLGIALFGGYYTYYQYNRMEEINSKKNQA